VDVDDGGTLDEVVPTLVLGGARVVGVEVVVAVDEQAAPRRARYTRSQGAR
jgi:hypothetical protein